MKMLILRFFHPSPVVSSLAVTSSCSGPPRRQSELLALRACKGGGGRRALPMHGLATPSCCPVSQRLPVPMPMDALGKEGTPFLQDTGGGGKGTGGRSYRQHSHLSTLPHPTLLAGKEAEETFPAVANAFTGYCSLAAVIYRQLQPTGSQLWEPATAAAGFGPDLRVSSSDSV